MKKNNSAFSNFVSPILVLVLICFVVTFALAMAYGVTKPIIDKNNLKESNKAKSELIPEAHGEFENYDGKLVVVQKNKIYATEASKAVNGSGVVVTVSSNSYGGALTAMVGIDNKGKITKVLVMSAQDTPGIGTKAQDPKHLEQYKGLNDLGSETIKDAKSKVKHITGASISSQAIHEAVFCGLKQYKAMGGAK
ncbi:MULTISPECIES: FMN-binding protein [Mogibacterium]|uniref:Electron transport complex, RnfABCDGE type, G subunit n=1 Tax=Mogibacterium timidum ATCC 33093 TaxID=1401079 RepID=X8J8K6_9FIRM|nr:MULTISPECIES: FMN-binding protein [Mogibacterium]EJU21958.1 electron transport complex, RnfABCDGE type, G subunit [Mogibacterium sp. CM50]EUC59979.1 electron transport complex, RnfABCDGE type, G subunit [Mogibacterium timidum ATCC 33093]